MQVKKTNRFFYTQTRLSYAVRFAVVASAISVTRNGAQQSLPFLSEINHFQKNNPHHE